MLSITGNELESIFTEYTCTQFIKMFRQQVLGGNRHWLEKYNTVMAVTLHCCYIITHIVKNKSLNLFCFFLFSAWTLPTLCLGFSFWCRTIHGHTYLISIVSVIWQFCWLTMLLAEGTVIKNIVFLLQDPYDLLTNVVYAHFVK